MKSLKIFLVLIVAASCSPNNPKRQPPPEVNEVVHLDPGTIEVAAESKVDILFVIDDSQSMKRHQENMSRNIKDFVKAFEKNALLDFHIGVTSAFDSRLKSYLAQYTFTNPKRAARIPDMTPLGQLIAPIDPETSQPITGPRFITKDTPNFSKVLERTLLVGAKPGPDQDDAPNIGPYKEEFFTPVQAVLTNNPDFYRSDAFLAIFFITDANDESLLGANDFRQFLISLKGGNFNMVQAYAALIPTGTPTDASCRRDKSGEPKKIEAFLDSFQNGSRRILNLCSTKFGARLAQFGKDIVSKLPEKIIEIPAVPESGTLKVYYGGQLLKSPDDYIHVIRTATNRDKIVISRDLDVKFEKGAKIRVDYVPVRLENQANGRAKPI